MAVTSAARRRVGPLSREDAVQNWKRLLGRHLRELREGQDITQAELANMMGFEARQVISLIEGGHTSIPSDRVADFAECLSVDPKELGRTVLRYQDPWLYHLAIGDDPSVRAELAAIPPRPKRRIGARKTLVDE